ncbi:MAG: hypothetical protein IM606_12935 [Cytophagales bacterium]|nr:hypothetical protein [Cytophagales bacterium]MCA6389492.1 hypothetical protein [Cytophagales bacterium]MCA6391830.1 hypothetical protein [Cytophagales bacterium]MCA6396082.1 hypothetical protein [Cytophagales bacterium]MCA6403336.1 hypothetical protein [Cytophagales bacterium]
MQKAGARSQRVCAARAAEIVGAGSLGRKRIFANRQDFLLLVLTLARRASMNGTAGSAQAKNGGLRGQARGSREAAESEARFCRKVNSVFEP